jgi:hypothetical protein
MQNLYSVTYTDSEGNSQYYAKGIDLDRAQSIKTNIGNALTIAITGENGFQGGGKLQDIVSDLSVVRAPRTGTSIQTKTTVTEALTVTASGQTLFTLSNTPYPGTITVTVAGSSARPDVIWELVNQERTGGSAMINITHPTLSVGDAVSATYQYQTYANIITVTDESPNESPDGIRTTFSLNHVYLPGTLVVTTDVDAVSGKTVLEGGGTIFELKLGSGTLIRDYKNRIAPPSGITILASYQYALDDDTAVPASETYGGTPPVWVGTPLTPGNTGYNGG